ncbi:hypothetical protein [Streptomyces sp. M92]|uniref:hypothetical protein n=1 Tax=Streptomyces sp. M92 TaxID=2944250 RepID=UPI0023490E70|nr:hypothetical protein [Streptomyces sp. M92]WCN07392.1 hypothetical protein M6G08_35730 [Streptomyces sp. M92]
MNAPVVLTASSVPSASASLTASAEGLLLTADLLLAGDLTGTTAAGRNRGACTALRAALEIGVDRVLDAAVPGLARATMRAKLLCLHHYTAEQTARRTRAVWSHLCLGCHYHQYEIGPAHDQVRVWRMVVGELVEELAS